VCRALLTAGANVNVRGLMGQTALHIAAYFVGQGAEVAQFLLEAGADIHARATQGDRTALHTAVAAGNVAVTLLLLRRGADVHTRDATGATPLDTARGMRNPRLKLTLEQYMRGEGHAHRCVLP
jgi:ankyrin repeat protein